MFHPTLFENDQEPETPLETPVWTGGSVDTGASGLESLYESTPLSNVYFSSKNMDNIQKLLRYQVYKEMNVVIDNQSREHLVNIMQSVFLKHDKNILKGTLEMYRDEIRRLNDITIQEILPHIVSEIQQHMDYLRDIKNDSYKMIDRPENDNIKGTREYKSVVDVMTGY